MGREIVTQIEQIPFNKDDFVEDESEEKLIYVKSPSETIKLPIIDSSFDEFMNKIKMTRISDEEIIRYYDEIKSGESRVQVINGQYINIFFDCLYCDYCGINLSDEDTYKMDDDPNDHKYYYCYYCHKDMCSLCYHEMTTGQPLPESKIYEQREPKLTECSQHRIMRRNYLCYKQYDCDECEERINENEMYSNRENNYDLCIDCAKSSPELIENFKLKNWKLFDIPNFFDFGSLMDWYPILQDDTQSLILYNYNKNSPHCGKIGFCAVDDHGRMGYYYINENEYTIEQLLSMRKLNLEALYEQKSKIGENEICRILDDSIELITKYPIYSIMRFFNMKYYFG